MRCAHCDNDLPPNTWTCASCGTPVRVPVRPKPVTVLALLGFAGGAIALVAGLVSLTSATGDASGTALAVALVALGALQLVGAIGLWTLKPYGRTIAIGLAGLGLLAIPIGTIVAALILVYFFKPGIKALFSGRSLTEEEATQAAEVNHSTLATVLSGLLVAIGVIAALGTVANFALSGLVRERISGNEASAIGSLRSINSAQMTFAAACGNRSYARTLAGLAANGFSSADLASDPVIKAGYVIALVPGEAGPDAPEACDGSPTAATYFVSAVPVAVGSTGTRYFSTSHDGTIYQSTSSIPVTQTGAPAGATRLF